LAVPGQARCLTQKTFTNALRLLYNIKPYQSRSMDNITENNSLDHPPTQDYRALMKRALLELREMKAKLASLESRQQEPIAIIGIGCRFPGGADTPEALWDLLCQGKDAITEVPVDRWNLDQYYHPNPGTPGKIYTRYGGFVPHLQDFDAAFFGIVPREATTLDPQQRLFLEVSWEALEQAGLNPQQLAKSKTGVFLGICNGDYSRRLARLDPTTIDAYLGTGNAHSTASGRLSYLLGFTGPCLSIDTACSSSLVTVHLACQSLVNHETDLALAGGVNRIFSPEVSINFSQARMLSPDGHCKTFDAAANGFVRSEGCGVVILKRLQDAINDGDRIIALIRGSAVNQDGHTSGLTVPSGPAQQAVIRQALTKAGLQPQDVSYIEAHGTGTTLGDPIEIGALAEVFSPHQSKTDPLTIGSLKTNLGHLESAAGIAGLIKVALQLQHQQITPHLHLKQLNPYIDWQSLPFTIPRELTPWQSPRQHRVAGVSSFGFSGTNAHVVVEEFGIRNSEFGVRSSEFGVRRRYALAKPVLQTNGVQSSGTLQEQNPEFVDIVQTEIKDNQLPTSNFQPPTPNSLRAASPQGKPQIPNSEFQIPNSILSLSAKTEVALKALADRYHNHLTNHPEQDLHDICFTANTGRAQFEHRLAIVATSTPELQEKLKNFQDSPLPPRSPLRTAFLFTGQGSQYVGMGQTLYETEPIFRQTLDRCTEILHPHLNKPLLDIIFGTSPPLPNPLQGKHDRSLPTPNPELRSRSVSFGETPNSELQTPNSLNQTAHTQPALFALEYALAQLWQSWGIAPDVVLGHSVGEYVAACIAGVFSLEEGLALIVARGRLMQALPSGSMVAVLASEAQVRRVLEQHPSNVVIATFNGPQNHVLSGTTETIQSVCQTLTALNLPFQPLSVSHAFHSPLMQAMLPEFAQIAAQISYHCPRIPLISNVTGTGVDREIANPDYWVNHVQQPVRFAEGMQQLPQQGITHCLEIGPSPILLGMGRQCLPQSQITWLPSLRRSQADWPQLLESLATLYQAGAKVDWQAFHRSAPGQKIVLPTYPFQRQRFWAEPESVSIEEARSHEPASEIGVQTDEDRLRQCLEIVEQLSDSEVRSQLSQSTERQ
jgi:acyl transferase domain-containing protein